MPIPGVPDYELQVVLGATRIDYDENKELSNRKKHGYSLESAVHYFEQLLLPIPHRPFMTSGSFVKNDEVRHMHMGLDDEGNVVFFVTTMRDQAIIRIITFRRATEAECREFYQQTGYNPPLHSDPH